MRAPDFWFRSGDWRATLLRPFAALYGGLAERRLKQAGVRAPVPVICVGNFTAGGAGKTPTAIAIAQMLRAAGEKPVFLTRGYGGALHGPHRVDLAKDDARAVGDEALLLARHAPVIKAVDRVAGAARAAELGSVIIMDDGLQNPSLTKDFTIAVIDAETAIGNGLCLPAGPLRAPLMAQLHVTDAVIIMGEGHAADALAPRIAPRPIWHANLAPDPHVIAALRGHKVFAFAGIGRPEKFFSMLQREGVIVAQSQSFPDHAPFDAVTLDQLAARARADNLIPVTTEKDAARIDVASWPELRIVPVTFVSPNDTAILSALQHTLSHRRV